MSDFERKGLNRMDIMRRYDLIFHMCTIVRYSEKSKRQEQIFHEIREKSMPAAFLSIARSSNGCFTPMIS